MKRITLVLCMLCISVTLFSQKKTLNFCTYYGDDAIYSSVEICNGLRFTSNSEAEAIVDEILEKIDLKRNFIVMQCPNIANAMAANYPSQTGENRYIIYDNEFLERVDIMAGTDWASISILAHEVGHHLNGHVLDRKGSRPDKEEEADEFSGWVLAHMGASLEEAQAAIMEFQSIEGSHTHPPRHRRLIAIKKGWLKGMGYTATHINNIINNQRPPNTKKNLEFVHFVREFSEEEYMEIDSDNAWYKMKLFITGDDLSNIESVTYYLHSTFDEPRTKRVDESIVEVDADADDGFLLNLTAYGAFKAEAIILFKNGTSKSLSRYLSL